MQTSKHAFTMIELVFVIVILGILSAIAIPKFSATRTDAQVSKASADISSIRSAIITERQGRLITGDNAWISQLSSNDNILFTGSDNNHTLLLYGVASGTTDGHWERTAVNAYTYHVGGKDCTFTYDGAGKFDIGNTADDNSTLCQNLVK